MLKKKKIAKRKAPLTFIDVFSGCGGLSLGLLQAGLKGLFAIEKNKDAFSTLKANLTGAVGHSFSWPKWLPVKHITAGNLLRKYKSQLEKLKGKVDLIAGGPPCQGFSVAGRRNPDDPRNKLTNEYLRIVRIIRPRYLLLENVAGFDMKFRVPANGKHNQMARLPYSEIVRGKLEKLGYRVASGMVLSQLFGVPQRRKRFIMFAVLKKHGGLKYKRCRSGFLFKSRRRKCRCEEKKSTPVPLTRCVGNRLRFLGGSRQLNASVF